jgi:hypothetical protein
MTGRSRGTITHAVGLAREPLGDLTEINASSTILAA